MCFVRSLKSSAWLKYDWSVLCLLENPSTIHPTTRPTHSITELMRKTRFSKDEIRHLYRTFKQVRFSISTFSRWWSSASFQDSPSGEVTKTRFATIFGTLFPSGGRRRSIVCDEKENCVLLARMLSLLIICFPKYWSREHGLHSIRRSDFHSLHSRPRFNGRSSRLDLRFVRYQQRWQSDSNSWAQLRLSFFCSHFTLT